MKSLPAYWESKKRAKRGATTWARTSQERRRIHRAYKKQRRNALIKELRREKDEGDA